MICDRVYSSHPSDHRHPYNQAPEKKLSKKLRLYADNIIIRTKYE